MHYSIFFQFQVSSSSETSFESIECDEDSQIGQWEASAKKKIRKIDSDTADQKRLLDLESEVHKLEMKIASNEVDKHKLDMEAKRKTEKVQTKLRQKIRKLNAKKAE